MGDSLTYGPFLEVAQDLELAGLIWQPEIGDEVSYRESLDRVSILVDPEGMTPAELRSTYIWLPTLEQMVLQCEARQAILYHAGLELNDTEIHYRTVIQGPRGHIETTAFTLRVSMGLALRGLLLAKNPEGVH